jgi:cellulose synthase operon protein C
MSRRVRIHAAVIAALFAVAGCKADTPEALLASGKDYLARNDTNAAIIQLKNALQKQDNLAEARFLLGRALLETGDAYGAEKELRRAFELSYPAEEVIPPLARAMVMLGESKKLIEEFSKSQVANPEGRAELQTAIGRAYLALNNVPAARTAFTSALTASPKYVPAHLGKAVISVSSRNLPEALATVDSALTMAPQNHEAWQLKGNIAVAQGDMDGALAAYRKALEAKPDLVAGHAAVISILVQQNRLDDAAAQLAVMRKVAPQHVQTFYMQAMLAYRQKNFTAARDAIQQQLKIAPDNLPGLLLAGSIEYESRSYAQAQTHLLKVLQHVPDNSYARRVLIASYLRSGQPAKALDALRPVLGRFEKDGNMLGLAGEVYMANGDPEQAAIYFAKSSALDPEDAGKRAALALIRLAQGESGAIRELEEAAALDTGTRIHLALIAAHMQRRAYDQALAAIDGLEKREPGSAIAHNLRGTALLGKKDLGSARRSFERALEADPVYFPAVANLANLDLGEKNPDAARKRFERVLAKDPKHVQALLALAELRARTGAEAAEVVALIRRAIAAEPALPGPRLALVRYHLSRKETKEAVAAAQQALATLPDRPEIVDAAGRAHQAAGETHQAIAMYNRLAALQPGTPQPFLRLAEVQISAKDHAAAMDSLRRALALKADLIEAQRGMIALHVDAGRTREAIAMAREVQKQRPKQAVGYMLEGDIHASQKNWTEAANVYRTGLRSAPSTELAVRLHAALTAAGGAGADQVAASWLKDHPEDDTFRFQIAQTALGRQDYAAAAQHYRRILERQPANAVVLNNLAWAAGQLKDPKAVEYAERANTLAPGQAPIMDTLGMLLVERGETARGLELLQKASALAPNSGEIRLNLAKALIQAGQKDAARRQLDELAKLGSNFPRQAEVARLLSAL